MTNGSRPPDLAPDLREFLEFVRAARGFDFTGYKPGTLTRRLQKCMGAAGVESYDAYRDYLEVDPAAWNVFFDTLLINVTSFFRDPEAWAYLEHEIAPRILASLPNRDPVRIWSAGCASGQEPYSLAMLFSAVLGPEDFQRRVKIYATDIDPDALDEARAAVYSTDELDAVPDRFRDAFAPVGDGRFEIRGALRRTVIFGNNDLTRDAPISRLDLLVCRNVLMYMNSDTQGDILRRFHFALKDTGFLFLGRAEMLLTHGDRFAPVDAKERVFMRVPGGGRVAGVAERGALRVPMTTEPSLDARALDVLPVPHLTVGADGTVAGVNRIAAERFGIRPEDVERPLRDLELSYRPMDLRSAIDHVRETGAPTILDPVPPQRPRDGERSYEVHVAPIVDTDGAHAGVGVTFIDVSDREQYRRELEGFRQELESATEELQAGNEELETMNEELQSTNEELETTNEELQASNEELETMNEELQASNDQIEAVNSQLRTRQMELEQAYEFTEAVLASLSAVVVVLDANLVIERWNPAAEDLWGLSIERVRGRSIFTLDIGLPVEGLRDPLRRCLDDGSRQERILENAADRRGHTFACRVTCAPLSSGDHQPRGVVVLMEAM